SRSFAEETSATTATTSLCASISARVFSNSSALRAQIESLQPSCAKATAHALPMPLLAAATIATRFLIPRSVFILQQHPRSYRKSRKGKEMANRLSHDGLSLDYRWLTAESTARRQLVPHPDNRSLSRGAVPALETKPHIEILRSGARRAARQSEEWR